MIAFLLSCALTAFAGCLYSFYMGYVDPGIFGWKNQLTAYHGVFCINSLTLYFGATIPAIQFMRSLRIIVMLFMVMVVLIINFKPNGLLGEWELTQTYIKKHLKDKNKFNRNSKES